MALLSQRNQLRWKKSKKLTPSQLAAAKRRAKAAGRPWPNLVDNAAVSRGKGTV
jgi:hypothetical protein